MSVSLKLILSDDLNREIDRAATETQSSKGEILRKAMQLYLTARHGSRQGLKLGLVDPKTDMLHSEIIGL
ncbi:transcriptional regulator [Collimonas antrihumi]|uniref:transcriptional regulator n=1 Tax=Collimonas antrihumi TaxID=1940615 RepID=UPI001B8C1AD7|nr:transcriptional regulator [Collimonas antrihumi]